MSKKQLIKAIRRACAPGTETDDLDACLERARSGGASLDEVRPPLPRPYLAPVR